MTASPLEVALVVAPAMEGCGVRYIVGGSLASSMSGEPRTTLDVDLVLALDGSHVPCVTRALEGDFHADVDAIRRAVRNRASVNAIEQVEQG